MLIRTALADKAQLSLVEFCKDNLKPGLCAERYAANFAVDLGADGTCAVFEIPASDCKRDHVVSLTFCANADFRHENTEN